MGTAPAPAPLVSAVRRAKDAYFAGGELTIHEMTVLRIYFKRILAKRNTPDRYGSKQPKSSASGPSGQEASRLRAQVDDLFHRSDIDRWLAEARSVGIYAFGKVPRN